MQINERAISEARIRGSPNKQVQRIRNYLSESPGEVAYISFGTHLDIKYNEATPLAGGQVHREAGAYFPDMLISNFVVSSSTNSGAWPLSLSCNLNSVPNFALP